MEMSWYWWSLSYVEVDLGIEGLNLINERRRHVKRKINEWGKRLNWINEVRE